MLLQSSPLKRKRRNFITEVLIPSLFQEKGGTRPEQPLFPKLKAGQLCITWIGHASFLIQSPSLNILVDPNWANWLFVIRRLKHAGLVAEQLPNIDLVLITHAHFDHLSRGSLRQVAARQPIIVPHGVGGLVENLGFKHVHEMKWWDELKLPGVRVTFTPAKHWGARVLVDRKRGYGGYVIRLKKRTIYHCGDSAYFEGFKEIGQKLAPEIALMPIGAYQPPSRREHHISPEQALQAFIELRAQTLVPMHWGTYRMSYEALHEPPQRLMKAAVQAGLLPCIRFLIEGMPQVF